nr:MAG TPA: hypothetical protein [Caudoviricetes sp.]
MNYVKVGSIIEQKRLARQEQISKSVGQDSTESLFEKSENVDSTYSKDLLPEVAEFKKSIEDNNLSKADADIYLNKIQRELTANPESLKLNQIRNVLVEYKQGL